MWKSLKRWPVLLAPMVTRHVLVLSLLIAVGCGSGDLRASSLVDSSTFSSVDSWYAPRPIDADFTPLAKECYAVVTEPLQPEAQAALTEVPAKRVSADDAARFAGGPLPDGKVYVILRAVVLNEETGAFYLGVRGRAVHIQHGCLGRHAVPMRRKAIIAVLPEMPDAVYVDCSMLE
jgi:hypothetical protein